VEGLTFIADGRVRKEPFSTTITKTLQWENDERRRPGIPAGKIEILVQFRSLWNLFPQGMLHEQGSSNWNIREERILNLPPLLIGEKPME
jgi:hypothetical protein